MPPTGPNIQDPSESRAEEEAVAEEEEEEAPLALVAATAAADEELSSGLDAHLEEMMGDAPVCDACGHITVRNGACYKCLNCGNSLGCS